MEKKVYQLTEEQVNTLSDDITDQIFELKTLKNTIGDLSKSKLSDDDVLAFNQARDAFVMAYSLLMEKQKETFVTESMKILQIHNQVKLDIQARDEELMKVHQLFVDENVNGIVELVGKQIKPKIQKMMVEEFNDIFAQISIQGSKLSDLTELFESANTKNEYAIKVNTRLVKELENLTQGLKNFEFTKELQDKIVKISSEQAQKAAANELNRLFDVMEKQSTKVLDLHKEFDKRMEDMRIFSIKFFDGLHQTDEKFKQKTDFMLEKVEKEMKKKTKDDNILTTFVAWSGAIIAGLGILLYFVK